MFFFEQTNQKTVVCLAAVLLGGAGAQNAQALFDRGVAIDNGKAARPDPAAAFIWYKRAAEAGSAAGAFNVGVMYDAGRGTAPDASQAAFWYAVAASEGEGRGAYNLAELYESGEGVPRNPALAAAWYKRASALGIAAGGAKARSLRIDKAEPVSVATPASARVTPMTVSATGDDKPGVSLVWAVPASRDAPAFFVEVAAVAGGSAKDVLSAMTPLSAMHVSLPVGGYASRVFTVNADLGRYTAGPWTRFEIAAGAAGGIAPR